MGVGHRYPVCVRADSLAMEWRPQVAQTATAVVDSARHKSRADGLDIEPTAPASPARPDWPRGTVPVDGRDVIGMDSCTHWGTADEP